MKMKHQNERLKHHMEVMDRRRLEAGLNRIDTEIAHREQEKLHLDLAQAHLSKKLQRCRSWNGTRDSRDDRARRFRGITQAQRQERFQAENNKKALQLERFEERKHNVLVEFPKDMLHEREVINNLQGNAVLDLINAYRRERLGTA